MFAGALTGQPIIGYTWEQSLAASTAQLAALLARRPVAMAGAASAVTVRDE